MKVTDAHSTRIHLVMTGTVGAMNRPSTLLLCVAAALLLLSGCSREDNTIPEVEVQDRIVQTATLVDASTLRVTWDAAPCETFDGVDFDLDDDYANVLIRVTVDVGNCPPGGFTETTIDLGEPLGDRQVWDQAFGDTVALTP